MVSKGCILEAIEQSASTPPRRVSRINRQIAIIVFQKLSCAGQSKIYGKSNHSNFLQFERIVQTRDLSAPATAAREDCEIKSQRGENSTTGGEMFFLLRMAFWLGLVLVLLPTDKSQDTDKAATPQVGAADAISAATAAVSDMSQFCTRQPGACAVGGQAATVIGHRAQAGAKKLYNMITEKRPPDHTGSVGPVEIVRAASGDTLTAEDLQVEWRAPVATSQRRG